MQSFLIISKNPQKINARLEELYKEFGVGIFDITEITGDIGIEQVRNLKKNIYLSPLKSPQKAVVVKVDKITKEAQNSLLKILEEPPNNTIIVVIHSNLEVFLPTILSRCFIIKLDIENKTVDENTLKACRELFKKIECAGVGERLKIASDFGGNKEEALKFLEHLILAVRQSMLETTTSSNRELLPTIRNFQKIHTIVNGTNVTPRFALEHALLNFSTDILPLTSIE